MKFYISAIFSVFLFLSFGCKGDKVGNEKMTSETLRIYSIKLDKDSVGVGNLTYKDIKYFDSNNTLMKQEFFDKAEILKGTEYIDRSKKERHSEYYSKDKMLLSYYDMVYDSDLLMLKSAFDGQTNDFLRAEQYLYDDKGNRKEKVILDAAGKVDRVYKFSYDEHDNEVGFSGFDENGEIFLLETYRITKKDSKNRWTEKWGYRENVPYTFSTREFSD